MKTDNSAVSMSFILFTLLYLLYLSVSRPLVRPSEAGGFGLVDGGGVEFALGGVYDGFVVVYVEREVVDFFSGRSVGAVLGYVWVAGESVNRTL